MDHAEHNNKTGRQASGLVIVSSIYFYTRNPVDSDVIRLNMRDCNHISVFFIRFPMMRRTVHPAPGAERISKP